MAGLTNRVYVRHSDPGAPLSICILGMISHHLIHFTAQASFSRGWWRRQWEKDWLWLCDYIWSHNHNQSFSHCVVASLDDAVESERKWRLWGICLLLIWQWPGTRHLEVDDDDEEANRMDQAIKAKAKDILHIAGDPSTKRSFLLENFAGMLAIAVRNSGKVLAKWCPRSAFTVHVSFTSENLWQKWCGPFQFLHDVIQKSSSLMWTTAESTAGEYSGTGVVSVLISWRETSTATVRLSLH